MVQERTVGINFKEHINSIDLKKWLRISGWWEGLLSSHVSGARYDYCYLLRVIDSNPAVSGGLKSAFLRLIAASQRVSEPELIDHQSRT